MWNERLIRIVGLLVGPDGRKRIGGTSEGFGTTSHADPPVPAPATRLGEFRLPDPWAKFHRLSSFAFFELARPSAEAVIPNHRRNRTPSPPSAARTCSLSSPEPKLAISHPTMAVEAPVSASQLAPADGALRDSPKGSAKRRRVSPNGISTPLHDNSGNATPTRSSPNPTALESAKKDRKLDRERSDSKDSARARDKDRESRLPACEACRTRKVKCDALLPACTPCQKSGRECFGRDKVPNVSRGLVYELQQKVKDLESRLALASSGATTNGSASKRGGPPAADDDGMASDAAETSMPRLHAYSRLDLISTSVAIMGMEGCTWLIHRWTLAMNPLRPKAPHPQTTRPSHRPTTLFSRQAPSSKPYRPT